MAIEMPNKAKAFNSTEEFNKLRKFSNLAEGIKKVNILIYGESGSGKTTAACTMPGPVLIHSFDPNGSLSVAELVAEGRIISDDRYQLEDMRSPRAWMKWEQEMSIRMATGFFTHIGTLVIDSITLWSQACLNDILRLAGRPGAIPQQQDYNVMTSRIRDWFQKLTTLPCSLVMTAHVDISKDDTTGRILAGPMIVGKLKKAAMLYFDEVYVSIAKSGAKGTEYSLTTAGDGTFPARTRIGRNKLFEIHETPDIRQMLKKAGIDIPDKVY